MKESTFHLGDFGMLHGLHSHYMSSPLILLWNLLHRSMVFQAGFGQLNCDILRGTVVEPE